jgi:hypothetical protein
MERQAATLRLQRFPLPFGLRPDQTDPARNTEKRCILAGGSSTVQWRGEMTDTAALTGKFRISPGAMPFAGPA